MCGLVFGVVCVGISHFCSWVALLAEESYLWCISRFLVFFLPCFFVQEAVEAGQGDVSDVYTVHWYDVSNQCTFCFLLYCLLHLCELSLAMLAACNLSQSKIGKWK